MKQYSKTPTREEKIKLLNNLKAGKVNLQDILPPEKVTIYVMNYDGTATNTNTREIISEAELVRRDKKENILKIIPNSLLATKGDHYLKIFSGGKIEKLIKR